METARKYVLTGIYMKNKNQKEITKKMRRNRNLQAKQEQKVKLQGKWELEGNLKKHGY